MPEDIDTIEVPKSAEDIAFEQMSTALDDIQSKRETLAKQLLEAAKVTKIDTNNDAPRMLEVKMALFKTADDLLKSQESLHINRAKMQLQRKSEASNDNVKALAVEVLRNINMNQKINAPVKVMEQVDKALQTVFDTKISGNEDLGGDIKEDELVVDEK